jgi:hypothetical protein
MKKSNKAKIRENVKLLVARANMSIKRRADGLP